MFRFAKSAFKDKSSESRQPHYVSEYRELFATVSKHHSTDEAMSLAVGGLFDVIGDVEVDVLQGHGMRDGHFVVDIGCGSGRLANAVLRRNLNIDYLGTDIVPELLDYAKIKAPANFQFKLHTELSVPVPNNSADFVTFFSVLTHLYADESFLYLRDAVRATKPGGAVLFSFIECELHWDIFIGAVERLANKTRVETTAFLERPMIEAWVKHLGVALEAYQSPSPLGQSLAVLRKSA